MHTTPCWIFPPAPILTLSQQLAHPSNVTWYIKFDRDIQRPLAPSYIFIFYDFHSKAEVYRIDASLSSQVNFNQSNGIIIMPTYSFSEKGKFYINFEKGVVRSTEGCGPPNEPVTSRELWTFNVVDVTPPVIVLLQNPMISNGNISLVWESNEKVAWQCSLVQDSMTTLVNCSEANWRGYDFSEGNYKLIITAIDDAGNVATLIHMFSVDLSPPSVTIVQKPSPISNQVRPTIRFTCNEVCNAECQLPSDILHSSIPISCNNRIFTLPTLQHNVTYILSIVSTDHIGNKAKPVTYTWETDFKSPVIFGISNTNASCSETSTLYLGQPQVADDKSGVSSLTYYDTNFACSIRRTWIAKDNAEI